MRLQFFCVLSELTIDKGESFKNDAFNIIYFVVPDITYDDLTLLMDQSHEVLCKIYGTSIDSLILDKYNQPAIEQLEETGACHVMLSDYLVSIGYVNLGKIYRIIFSDEKKFDLIKNDNEKFLNLLASEDYKDPETECAHLLALSETDTEHELHHNNRQGDSG